MQRTFFTLLLFLCVGTCKTLYAQAVAVSFTNTAEETSMLLENEVSEDWTLYADEENKLFYIDFENLKVNVSDVVVKNQTGEIILKDNVFNLPVNTIYELDFSNYQAGNYEIELRTFTGSIRRKISIK